MCISVIPPNDGDADWIEKLVTSPALDREIEDENLHGPRWEADPQVLNGIWGPFKSWVITCLIF